MRIESVRIPGMRSLALGLLLLALGAAPGCATGHHEPAPDAGTLEDAGGPACEPGPLAVDPDGLPQCNLCSGTLARCLPGAYLPEGSAEFLADCPGTDGLKCVPDHFIETGGGFLLDRCTSLEGAEGRCLPDCIPDVAAQASLLPQDVCAAGELCAPCFDPITGEDTGACHQGCDPGPTEPPVTFARCCGDRGACVPTTLVPEAQLAQLGVDTCAEQGTVCAPSSLALPTSIPPACAALGGSREGRCLPDCLPAVAAQASLLDRGTPEACALGELCAPCYDPTTGEDTGACRLNGDAPVDPAPTFENCCDGRGVCLDPAVVPAEQESQLGPGGCTVPGALCAPVALTDPAFEPAACDSVGGAEGRCLPDCLPAIAAQSDRLSQATCAAGELCAPCYDPLTGADTGACRLNGDAPNEPPFTFQRCCGDRGACVPTSLVPPDQIGQLGTDSCLESGTVCAPDDLQDPAYEPPSCDSIAGAEGRCLPDCLPSIAAQSDRLPQSTCAAGNLCAPCYDPITGEDTGACRLNGDAPNETPYVFPTCCEYEGDPRGRCVPPSEIPDDQEGALKVDTCTDPALCVPDPFLTNPSYSFPSCEATVIGVPSGTGACVPDCLVSSAQKLTLARRTCAAGELCAPCTLLGSPTGACN